MLLLLRKFRPNTFVSYMLTRLLVALLVAYTYGAPSAHAPTRTAHYYENTSHLTR